MPNAPSTLLRSLLPLHLPSSSWGCHKQRESVKSAGKDFTLAVAAATLGPEEMRGWPNASCEPCRKRRARQETTRLVADLQWCNGLVCNHIFQQAQGAH